MSSVVVLSHRNVANELGHLEPWFERNDFQVSRIYREDGQVLPNSDLLVVLGSPNSVATGHCEPPAVEEIAIVGEWVKQGRPYLGICFGAQILASALGGSVRRMPVTYRSFAPMSLTDKAPQSLNGCWPLWHEDAITAPDTSSVLATLPHADTVFVHGTAWGVQPHIEFTPDAVDRLGLSMNIPSILLDPILQAMKDDEIGLFNRAQFLLDTFWTSVNSLSMRNN